MAEQPSLGGLINLAPRDVGTVPETVASPMVPPAGRRVLEHRIGQRPGVPLVSDESPLTVGQRAYMGLLRSPESRLKWLRKTFGEDTVDVAPNGEFVMRNILDPETGKIRDVYVDESGFNALKDFADFSAVAPEVAAAAIALRTGVGARAMAANTEMRRRLGMSAVAAAGSSIGGVTSDIVAKAAAGLDLNLKEAPADAGKQMLAEFISDVALTGAFGFLRKLPSRAKAPFRAERPDIQRQALLSAETLEGKYGQELASRVPESGGKIPFTPGEATGSPWVQRAEAYSAVIGGDKTAVARQDIRRRTITELEELMVDDMISGRRPRANPADSGVRAVDALSQSVDAVRRDASEATARAVSAASEEFRKVMGLQNPWVTVMYNRKVGEAIRGKAVGMLKQVKAESAKLYDDLYAMPLAREKIIPTKQLQEAGTKALADMPTRGMRVEAPENVVTMTGERPKVIEGGKEILREWTPPGLISKLRSLENLDPEMSLRELATMRTTVGDAIQQGDLLPGVSTGYLRRFYGLLTDTINQGIKGTGDPAKDQLASAWDAAVEHYAREMPKFEKRGVRALMVEEMAPGYVGDAAVVERIVRGEGDIDALLGMRDLLGANSPEYGLLKLHAKNSVYEAAFSGATALGMAGGDQLVDAGKMFQAIKSLNREVAEEVFGKDAVRKIKQFSGVLGEFQGTVKIADYEKAIFESNTAVGFRKQLNDAVQAKAKLDKAYENNIIKSFVKDGSNIDKIDPVEFVNRFVEVTKNPDSVREVMDLIRQSSPELAEDIQAATLESLFYKLERQAQPADIQKMASRTQPSILSPQKLRDVVFSDRETRGIYEAVLGRDKLWELSAIADILAVDLAKKELASAGGIAAGMTTVDFMKGKPIRGGAKILWFKAISRLLGNDVTSRWFTQSVARPDTTLLSRGIVTFMPAIMAGSEELEGVGGYGVVSAFYDLLNAKPMVRPAEEQGTLAPQISLPPR